MGQPVGGVMSHETYEVARRKKDHPNWWEEIDPITGIPMQLDDRVPTGTVVVIDEEGNTSEIVLFIDGEVVE